MSSPHDWLKATVDAPDAYYRMAIAHYEPAPDSDGVSGGTVTVSDRARRSVASYQLTRSPEWLTEHKFRSMTSAGPIVVDKDPRCSTCGNALYQRTLKGVPS